jgi:hypothetical protein
MRLRIDWPMTVLKSILLLVFSALMLMENAPTAQAAEQESDSGVLHIDPLLIAQAAEVWTIIGGKDNAIWDGWDATNTPLLIYLPGVQDVLVNHLVLARYPTRNDDDSVSAMTGRPVLSFSHVLDCSGEVIFIPTPSNAAACQTTTGSIP